MRFYYAFLHNSNRNFLSSECGSLGLISILISILLQYADGTILVTRLESCANSMIKFVSTINSIDDGRQVFNVNYSASIPNGENLRVRNMRWINCVKVSLQLWMSEKLINYGCR